MLGTNTYSHTHLVKDLGSLKVKKRPTDARVQAYRFEHTGSPNLLAATMPSSRNYDIR
jgi:hypothetical protein